MEINGFKIINDNLRKNGRRAYEILCPHCNGKKIVLAQTIDGRKTQSCGCLINLSDELPVKYHKNYSISKKGEVKNIKTGRILVANDNGSGYKLVSFRILGKKTNFYIHRLVAEHFIKNENQETMMEVNHIDGNKSNNNVHNLEWIDRGGNIKHCYRIGKRFISETHKQKLKDGLSKRNEELAEHRNKKKEIVRNRKELNNINFAFRGKLREFHSSIMNNPTNENLEVYKKKIEDFLNEH